MVNMKKRLLHNENQRILTNQTKLNNLNEKNQLTMYKSEAKSNEYILHGRNNFAFWTVVSLLFLFAAANLLLTLTIFGVLNLGKGIAFLEVSQV